MLLVVHRIRILAPTWRSFVKWLLLQTASFCLSCLLQVDSITAVAAGEAVTAAGDGGATPVSPAAGIFDGSVDDRPSLAVPCLLIHHAKSYEHTIHHGVYCLSLCHVAVVLADMKVKAR